MKASRLTKRKGDEQIDIEMRTSIRNAKQLEDEQPSVHKDDFTAGELEIAINGIKDNKANGPDGISGEMLKELPIAAIQIMLSIINQCWRSGNIPQIWRKATLVPILKKGKPASELSSYRPIALTCVMCKVMEKMVEQRLRSYLESNNLINIKQAGFRANHSTEDQVVRVVQSVFDGLQERKRTIMALFDFRKAYDRVWHSALLLKMCKLGIPHYYIQYVRGLLRNRMMRAKVGNTHGEYVKSRNGLPQGSVISPLLFLIFVNDITKDLDGDLGVSLFADDLAVWSQDKDKFVAERKMQKAVDIIGNWSKRWNLDLNVNKCEVVMFTKDVAEIGWRPDIKLNGQPIAYNANPTFLGVKFDPKLRFDKHVEYVLKRMAERTNIIKVLKRSDWANKEVLVRMYGCLVKPLWTYCAAVYLTWSSKTAQKKVDTMQNAALRIATGLYKTSPLEAIRLESGVIHVEDEVKCLAGIAYERALRLPNTHPGAIASNETVTKRLKQKCWREVGKEVSIEAGLVEHRRMSINTTRSSTRDIASMEGRIKYAITTKDEPEEVQLQSAINIISDNLLEGTVTIYCDGSAKEGNRDGGGGVAITTGEPERPTIGRVWQAESGNRCSSFDAEAAAMESATNWISEQTEVVRYIVCCDNRALVSSVQHANNTTNSLNRKF